MSALGSFLTTYSTVCSPASGNHYRAERGRQIRGSWCMLVEEENVGWADAVMEEDMKAAQVNAFQKY